mmetsp:Transcript_1949/g.5162  ORF Transcript_1949/g.5162 Transcript_1949/m.5162 type:complete len:228 (-) Transcript_1949:29-712(-)
MSNFTSAKRSLRFANQTQIFIVTSSRDMSEEEVEATWYCQDEYNAMKRSMKRAARRMQNGDVEDSLSHCTRGLEHLRSPAHLEQHRINKDMVIESVINEQDKQWKACVNCPSGIAVASSTASQWARDLATSRGSADAEFAQSLKNSSHQMLGMWNALKLANSSLDCGSDLNLTSVKKDNKTSKLMESFALPTVSKAIISSKGVPSINMKGFENVPDARARNFALLSR